MGRGGARKVGKICFASDWNRGGRINYLNRENTAMKISVLMN